MAATIYFVGGPCDGRRRAATYKAFTGEVTRCDGAFYDLTVVSATYYRAVWQGASAADTSGQFQAGSDQFDKAWNGLMQVLAYKVPAATDRIRAAGSRIRKAVK